MPNTLVPHPDGSNFFGQVYEKTTQGVLIPGGPIVLKRGRYGSGGFGARHIWQRHEKEVRKAGFQTEEEVVLYVARIVFPGTPLYYEHGHIRGVRVTVVRGVLGTAILEHKPSDPIGPCYSIVTAFGQRNPIGSRIGSIGAIKPPEGEPLKTKNPQGHKPSGCSI